MLRPRKRKLYTPISPVSDEEIVEIKKTNQIEPPQAEQLKPVEQKLKEAEKHPVKNENPVLSSVDTTKNKKITALETAQNFDWNDLKMRFNRKPLTSVPSCPRQRFNTLDVANSIASKNFKDTLINDHINLVDIIRKKIMRDKERDKPKPAVLINIHCDSLKSMFLDHEASSTVMVVEKAAIQNPIKLQKGFISSHMIEKLTDSSAEASDVIDENKSTNELITKDVLDEWLKEFYSAASTSKSNPIDCGVFPSTISLASSSKKVAQTKRQQLDSIIPS